MDAIAEQIVPTNEWAGAKDAHVTNFIDKQLTNTYKRFQESYRKGLYSVTLSCELLFNEQFEAITWEKQFQFLTAMESGKLSKLQSDKIKGEDTQIWKEGFDRTFFNLVRDHVMQGYYGSPRHGGNYRYVSYRMIGLEPLQIIGQNRYR